jgi:hypothetical protein
MLLGGAPEEFVSIKAANLKIDPVDFTAAGDSDGPDGDEALPPRAAGTSGAPSAAELAALPIRELRAIAAAAGLDTTGSVEKGDYVQLLAGPAAAGA